MTSLRFVAILSLLVSLTGSMPFSLAQTSYWDNSTDNQQPYYAPSNTAPPPQNNYNYSQPAPNNYYAPQTNTWQQPNMYGQSNYGQPGYSNNQPSLRGYVSSAPAGTNLTTTTTTSLSSDTARVGDPVSVTLGYDLSMGGNMLLPSGTQIQGQVVSAVPAGRAGKHGQLQLRFNRAQLPDGRSYPLSARVVTDDGTGIIRGGTKAQRVGGVAKNTLGGAAIGAAAGTALGAIVGGGHRWNEGMLWGSVLGAGAGLAKSGVERGEEATVQPGTQLQIMLDQQLSISPSAPSSYSTGYPY